MNKPLVNRVAQSKLITIKLEEWISTEEAVDFDIADFLFKGLIIKEKEFREALDLHIWEQYSNKNFRIHCSKDVIIPIWAYMLITSKVSPYAKSISFGTKDEVISELLLEKIHDLDLSIYKNQKVVIKGCGDYNLKPLVYIKLVNRLNPIVQSLMFGEPCSTVPIFKQSKAK